MLVVPAWHWVGTWLGTSPVTKTRAAAVACIAPAVTLTAADEWTLLLPVPFVHSLLCLTQPLLMELLLLLLLMELLLLLLLL
jgi:hypothetical protein